MRSRLQQEAEAGSIQAASLDSLVLDAANRITEAAVEAWRARPSAARRLPAEVGDSPGSQSSLAGRALSVVFRRLGPFGRPEG